MGNEESDVIFSKVAFAILKAAPVFSKKLELLAVQPTKCEFFTVPGPS